MDSGWIINFKDGRRVLLTEDEYLIFSKNRDENNLVSEEHWFLYSEAKRKYPFIQIGIG